MSFRLLDRTDRPLRSVSRMLRCLVCGFAELRTDEVVDRGLVFLAECPRCEHRFTSTRPIAAAAPAPLPVRWERGRDRDRSAA